MKRRWWIAGIAGVAALALVGAGVVMAQTATPGASGSSPSFLDRVAQKLGIETPKLQAAITGASNDQIDAEVASGRLTQSQADKLKAAIASGKFPSFAGPLLGGHESFSKGGFGPGLGAGVDLSKLADFLSIAQDTLRTELQTQNATLVTVATAHGKSRDDLKAFITSSAKTRLDQAVTDKKLTQAQADAALAMMTKNLDSVIDHQGFGGHARLKPGMTPGAPGTPNSSATPGTTTRFRRGSPGAPSAPATSAIFSS